MRCIVQRVNYASVKIDGKIKSSIEKGLLVLVGYENTDTKEKIDFVCDKLLNLRIFNDECDKLNLSLLDVGGEMLVVSNFTVYGDTTYGRRPSFTRSAKGEVCEPLYEYTLQKLSQSIKIKSGVFGADMKVLLENDGPITVIVEK